MEEDLEILFENGDKETCFICGKKSLPNFYRACCDKHRLLHCDIFMKAMARVSAKLPKVNLILNQ